MLDKIIIKPRYISLAFIIVAFAHLLLFIKYPASLEANGFTAMGEELKTWLPAMLLFTLLPRAQKNLNKIITVNRINILGSIFITMCIGYQLFGVSGQAWSTLAFSGLLILLLFNNLTNRYNMSKTLTLVFSFMIVWLGWVLFEIVFQVGLWFHYPSYFQYTDKHLFSVLLRMGQWLFPALLYIYFVISEKKMITPRIKLGNYWLFAVIIVISTISTYIWFSNNMLIPIPVDAKGVFSVLEINYWTQEHLWFSVSRLSQISIMSALPILFLRKGVK